MRRHFLRMTALVLFLALLLLGGCGQKTEGVVSTVSFHDAINVQELSTAEFIYNSVVDYEKNGQIIHIKYGATVKAGIDLEGVAFTTDEKNKVLKIVLPQLVMNDVIVDESMMEYIPANPDLDMAEVISICKEDVRTMAAADDKFMQAAADNLRTSIMALLSPLVKDDGYALEFYQNIDGKEVALK